MKKWIVRFNPDITPALSEVKLEYWAKDVFNQYDASSLLPRNVYLKYDSRMEYFYFTTDDSVGYIKPTNIGITFKNGSQEFAEVSETVFMYKPSKTSFNLSIGEVLIDFDCEYIADVKSFLNKHVPKTEAGQNVFIIVSIVVLTLLVSLIYGLFDLIF